MTGISSSFRILLSIFALLSAATALIAQNPETPVQDSKGDEELSQLMIRLSSDGDEEVIQAIKDMALTGDTRLENFFDLYRQGSVYLWEDAPEGTIKIVVNEETEENDDFDELAPLFHPLTNQPILINGKQAKPLLENLTDISPGRKVRKIVTRYKFHIRLFSPDPKVRLSGVKKSGTDQNIDSIDALRRITKEDSHEKIRWTARESLLLIRLAGKTPDSNFADRMGAIRELGEIKSLQAPPHIEKLQEGGEEFADLSADEQAEAAKVAERAIKRIEDHQSFVDRVEKVFQGFSAGSILILLALGLAITFGLMGVINMAHGEMMMIGAVTTWAVHEMFVGSPYFEWYFVIALPLAFLTAALSGIVIEWLILRHLYKRPLDSLLATIGVSFILIQAVRMWKGDNLGMSAPSWLTGGWEITRDVILPYDRLFIIGVVVTCVVAIGLIMRFSRLGLMIRATVQDRQTAQAMGVNTRMVDMFTFALGAGLAGIAGWSITLFSNVNPEMGQAYIVDSFLVVVVGGVGKLVGVICSGLGIGFLLKFIEPLTNSSWAKVIVLMLVVIFIRFRPAGLFPDKGRLADAADNLSAAWRPPGKYLWKADLYTGIGFALLLLLIFPVLHIFGFVSPIDVTLTGMFLAVAIVAIGLDLIWGYMGVLSLCQFLFFSLGGYCMGFYLANHGPMDQWGIPESLSYVESTVGEKHPPWFLGAFRSFPISVFLGLLIPGLVALLIGLTTFVSRVRGVYFAILTQAITVAAWLVFMNIDNGLGGTNGVRPSKSTILGAQIQPGLGTFPEREAFESTISFMSAHAEVAIQQTRFWLYMVTATVLLLLVAATRYLSRSPFGRVLVAIRDDESRLRFSGYQPWAFKTMAFVIAALLAAIGGMLYVPQTLIITPQKIEAIASIMVVVWVALGGRASLWGVVVGAVLVNFLKEYLTNPQQIFFITWDPRWWKLALGGVFIMVPLFLPGGLMQLFYLTKARLTGWIGRLVRGRDIDSDSPETPTGGAA